MINALQDATATGDTSAFNMGQGVLGGAAAGFAAGGPVGALVGALSGGTGTFFLGRHAQRRRGANLNRFTNENLISSSLSAEEQLANFNATMENVEEVAAANDMSVDALTDRLNYLKPAFDDIHNQIEAKVAPRVKMLTELFGYNALEADQLARSMDNLDFGRFVADQFNNIAMDVTGGFGFAARFQRTSANKSLLRSEQAGLEASLRSQFGGDLDVAARSEEGRRQIEALFNNIVSQAMLVDGQSGLGAEMTAIGALETIFGSSDFVTELETGNAELLSTDLRIEKLLQSSDGSLESIASIMDYAFGGGAEARLRGQLALEYQQMYAGSPEALGGQRSYINERIGPRLAAMLQVSNPINVQISGMFTDAALARIKQIADEAAARIESDVLELVADEVGANEYSEDTGGVPAVIKDALELGEAVLPYAIPGGGILSEGCRPR